MNTLYPVVPVHTVAEKALFRRLMNEIERFDKQKMTADWNLVANGATIYYKLPEHLENYKNAVYDKVRER